MKTIKNKKFSASILANGAELRSLKNKITGEEFIWQADPSVWPKSAPLLFPIVGNLNGGITSIEGQEYKIPKHGFARDQTFELLEQESDRIVFGLAADDLSRQMYPYDFALTSEFKLTSDGLEVNYAVQNKGAKEMLFSIGFHPAFALDLSKAPLSSYYLEFSTPESLDLYGLSGDYLVKKQAGFLREERVISLSEDSFSDDALIFENVKSRSVRLARKGAAGGLELELRNAPHLGVWAKPGAAFVCIEPWFSFNDSADSDGVFKNKPGILTLAPGATFETGYTVRIRESISAIE